MDKQKVYNDIRQQILDERLHPGQWVAERELCDAYGLSRTPIREILWKLTADGFLEQEPNRGFMVRKLGLEQIFELFQTREAVEGMAVRLACRKGDEAFKATLRDIKEKLVQLDVEADPHQGIALGRRMHVAIISAASNGMLSEIYQKLNNLAMLTSNITKKSPTIEKVSLAAHLLIIDSIMEQDEVKSERLMREHMRDTCRQVVEQFYPGMLMGSSNSPD